MQPGARGPHGGFKFGASLRGAEKLSYFFHEERSRMTAFDFEGVHLLRRRSSLFAAATPS